MRHINLHQAHLAIATTGMGRNRKTFGRFSKFQHSDNPDIRAHARRMMSRARASFYHEWKFCRVNETMLPE